MVRQKQNSNATKVVQIDFCKAKPYSVYKFLSIQKLYFNRYFFIIFQIIN